MTHGPLIAEGKTKKIYAAESAGDHCIVEYKNAITAFDNPKYTREFTTKAKHSNTVNCRVFEMLNAVGIPTAFVQQTGETEFEALSCTMIPLEIVVRRYAVGSYLKRHPELKTDGDAPHRFVELLVEFFVKTTKGTLVNASGDTLIEGLDPLKGEEDPFVADAHADTWALHLSKLSVSPETKLREVRAADILPSADAIALIESMARAAFTTVESFLAKQEFKLIDFKIECGVTPDGRIVIADVIDNDSWRLRDAAWRDVSKQSFRDGEDLATIEDKYALVAGLFSRTV